MVKRLQESDVVVGAAYRADDSYFVVLSKHRDVAFVRFESGNTGYVEYKAFDADATEYFKHVKGSKQ